MTDDERIGLLAAPIYAGLLMPWVEHSRGEPVPAETLKMLRRHAVIQAKALWLDITEPLLSGFSDAPSPNETTLAS